MIPPKPDFFAKCETKFVRSQVSAKELTSDSAGQESVKESVDKVELILDLGEPEKDEDEASGQRRAVPDSVGEDGATASVTVEDDVPEKVKKY